jgi:MFS family permease
MAFGAFCGALTVLARAIAMHNQFSPHTLSRRRANGMIASAWTFAVGTGGAAFARFFDQTHDVPMTWRDFSGPLFVLSSIVAMYIVMGIRFDQNEDMA